MTEQEIRAAILALRDESYRDFVSKLIPSVAPERIAGVRVPSLRTLAKRIAAEPDTEAFLAALPHELLEENHLHAFLLSLEKNYDSCLRGVEAFLPYIDNWATCDSLSPRVFRKHREALDGAVRRWLCSPHPFAVRFGIKMRMEHWLDADFSPAHPDEIASIRSEEYYVNMMIAWYFATALAKQYDAALPILEQRKLDRWTHNKTIQKAIESFRIPEAHKAYLGTLRQK